MILIAFRLADAVFSRRTKSDPAWSRRPTFWETAGSFSTCRSPSVA